MRFENTGGCFQSSETTKVKKPRKSLKKLHFAQKVHILAILKQNWRLLQGLIVWWAHMVRYHQVDGVGRVTNVDGASLECAWLKSRAVKS